MALKSGISGTIKLIGFVLSPSLTSGILTVFVSALIVGGALLLTHIGGATQQSILGLHNVYRNSPLGTTTDAVGQHLGSNTLFNNAVLFVLWGSVGLVVYSIVQGFANELKNTDELLRELSYVHADKHTVVRDLILRSIIRFVALGGWWLLAWVLLHKVLPFAIASAQASTYNLANVHDWVGTLLGFVFCVIGFHALVVLLRLIVLRPRLTGNSILDNQ